MTKTSIKSVMPIIYVESINLARDFYIEKLGFDHVMGMLGQDGQFDFGTVALGGARIMLARPQEAMGDTKPIAAKRPVEIYLQVDDVDAYHAQLKRAGVKMTSPLSTQWWGDRTFRVIDPYGYELWFYQTVGAPTPPAGAKIV